MNFAPMVVNFLGMKINTLDHDSAATVGPYLQVDTFVSEKRNYGFGEENGDFAFINIPISAVNDPDVIDSTSAKGSVI
jgi:pimeloyl-CoA synthetase